MPKFRIVLLLAAAVAVSACAHQSPAPAPPAPAAAPAAAASAAPDPDAAHMPEGPGKALTARTCSDCHSLARVVAQHQTRAQWQQTLSAMEDNGLSVTPEELKTILDYLSRNYGAGH
jgi:cytochrome c5